jgi:carbon storage regulator
MLILSRRAGEAILIDGGVRVVVLGVDGNGVRLGIEAPSSVGIVREELAQRIAEENIRAGATEDARVWLESLNPAQGEGEGEEESGEGAPESRDEARDDGASDSDRRAGEG